jgi:hypothetical protein
MKRILLTSAFLLVAGLAACDKPTVVNMPPAPAPIPGPAGPTGAQGNDGIKGNTGASGEGTTVIVTPPAASAPN